MSKYDWEVTSTVIKFDPRLDIDKLGWKHGDYFRITNINGQAMLIKVDPLVAFAEGHLQINTSLKEIPRRES